MGSGGGPQTDPVLLALAAKGTVSDREYYKFTNNQDMTDPEPVHVIDDQVIAILDGLGTVTVGQLNVTSAQVAVPTTALTGRKSISFKALAANGQNIYVGLTGVTTTTGYELRAGDALDVDADASVAFFAIAPSGTQRIVYMEIA